jgi:hypothetical protein
MKRKECGTNISRFGDLGFQMSNNNTLQFLNYERRKGVRPTLRYFGIQGFGVSNVKQQHTIIPKFRKVKGVTTIIQDFRIRGFKCQTTTLYNS